MTSVSQLSFSVIVLFVSCCDKIPDKNTLKEKGFILTYRFRGIHSLIVGTDWQEGQEDGRARETNRK